MIFLFWNSYRVIGCSWYFWAILFLVVLPKRFCFQLEPYLKGPSRDAFLCFSGDFLCLDWKTDRGFTGLTFKNKLELALSTTIQAE